MAEVDPAVIREQAFKAADEICEAGKLTSGQLFVVGCSTSEVLGEKIGTHYSMDVAKALYSGIAEALSKRGVLLAAQCCMAEDEGPLSGGEPRSTGRCRS